MKTILAINGSTRNGSVNEQILNWLARRHQETLRITIYEDIANLPHFNPDRTGDAAPEIVKEFYAMVQNAGAVIICTPEYVFSLPGAMKNVLEWLVSTTLLAEKPTGMIVASSLGEKTFGSLQLILKTLGASIGQNGALLLSSARTKVDTLGNVVDEDAIINLDLMMQELTATIKTSR